MRTSGGNITIGAVDGNVDADTSGGNITIDRAGGEVRAETSGGNIEVDEVGGKIEASTSGGNVRATITEQPGLITKSSIRGTINGGGPELRLRASGGSIRIREQ